MMRCCRYENENENNYEAENRSRDKYQLYNEKDVGDADVMFCDDYYNGENVEGYDVDFRYDGD